MAGLDDPFEWVLVAPPHFAGLVEQERTAELKKRLLTTVRMDLSHLDPHRLEEKLGERELVRLPEALR